MPVIGSAVAATIGALELVPVAFLALGDTPADICERTGMVNKFGKEIQPHEPYTWMNALPPVLLGFVVAYLSHLHKRGKTKNLVVSTLRIAVGIALIQTSRSNMLGTYGLAFGPGDLLNGLIGFFIGDFLLVHLWQTGICVAFSLGLIVDSERFIWVLNESLEMLKFDTFPGPSAQGTHWFIILICLLAGAGAMNFHAALLSDADALRLSGKMNLSSGIFFLTLRSMELLEADLAFGLGIPLLAAGVLTLLSVPVPKTDKKKTD